MDIGFFFSISSRYFLLSSSFGAVDEKESLLPCRVIACGKPLLFPTFIISQFEKTTASCRERHGNQMDGQDTIYLMVCLKLCEVVKWASNSVFHYTFSEIILKKVVVVREYHENFAAFLSHFLTRVHLTTRISLRKAPPSQIINNAPHHQNVREPTRLMQWRPRYAQSIMYFTQFYNHFN